MKLPPESQYFQFGNSFVVNWDQFALQLTKYSTSGHRRAVSDKLVEMI